MAQNKLKVSTTEAILIKALLDEHLELIGNEMNADQALVFKRASQEIVVVNALLERVNQILESSSDGEQEDE